MTQREPDGDHAGGRRRSERRQRQKIVAVRFTEAEYAVLLRVAARTGKSAAGLLRETFLRDSPDPKPEES